MSESIIQFTRTSPFTGIEHTKDIDVGDMDLYLAWVRGDILIQAAMPNVSAEDREFIKTGITPDEWVGEFGDDQAGKRPHWQR